MDKSPEAFRTISEVAEALETPAHVLRFWESRFPQIRPVKRAGGRRYYRPSDVALLAGIKRLLHDEGMTIRGVQKILREHGVRHVSGLSEETSPEAEALEAAMIARHDVEAEIAPSEAAEATAAALEAALEAPVSNIIAFPPADPAAPAAPEEPMPMPAADPRQTHFPGFEPEEPEPVIEAAGVPEPPPAEVPGPPPEAPPPPPEEAPPAPPPEAPPAPPTEVPLDSPPPESARPSDGPRPTAAARLRALRPGTLAGRQVALGELAQRIASLRARLGNPPPGA
ncbi:MerR family transcriptional regulator [Neotabrizicola sp. VNH66]|uniref:MerR family transcriptional regulator n=1 Tax=Neotabrizicola sp. VNH66 TaxID=3400918 RepID=UPI003C0C8C2A